MPVKKPSGGGGRRTPAPRRAPAVKQSNVPVKRYETPASVARRTGGGPVKVYVKAPALKAPTKRAIRGVNRVAGGKVFRVTKAPKAADVVVKQSRAKSKPLGFMNDARTRRGGRSVVRIGVNRLGGRRTKMPRATKRTVQHELGHTVGLGHPGPKKNPYLQRGVGGTRASKSRRSGVMGSGRRLSSNERTALVALRRALVARGRKRRAATRRKVTRRLGTRY